MEEAEQEDEGKGEEWEMETADLGLEDGKGQEGEDDAGRGSEDDVEDEETHEDFDDLARSCLGGRRRW